MRHLDFVTSPWRVLVGALLLVSVDVREAHAQSGVPRAAPSVVEAQAGSESYGLPLTAGYVLAPALAVAAGAGIFELTEGGGGNIGLRRGVAIAVGSMMFALPAVVHTSYAGPRRALVSLASMLGVTVVGAAAFGSLGYLLAKSSCDRDDPDYEAEGCGFQTEALTLIGSAVGAVIGYTGHAIYDVMSNSSVPGPSREQRNVGGLRLWLAPIARSSAGRSGAANGSGVRLMGTLQF